MRPRKITGARPTAIGSKATTPSQASRATASRNGGAATRAGKGARTVDWDAVIARFKRDMRKRYAEERAASRDETDMAVCDKTVASEPEIAQRGRQGAKNSRVIRPQGAQ